MNITRDILPDILSALSHKKIIILKGPRQVGKTTLMRMVESHLTGVKTAFLLLDDLSLASRIHSSKDLIDFLRFEHGYKDGEEWYIFLDEFQVIPQSGLFLKNLYDAYPNLQIIASGSSSLEITKNTEFLTGRKIVFEITPFSFREYLRARDFRHADSSLSFDSPENIRDFYEFYKKELVQWYEEYLIIGGYPEIVTSSGAYRKQISSDIIDTYIQKDITAFLRVENITAFNNLLRLLSAQIGNLVNKSELTSTLGISINTLGKYLDILEGTFVIDFLLPYFSNIRKELSKMPKVYFHDLGIRNYLLYGNLESLPIQDIGALVENEIHNALRYRGKLQSLHFYRTISKMEVDFIVQKPGDIIIPIEVKYRNKLSKLENIATFRETYQEKVSHSIIISKDTIEFGGDVSIIPACIFSLIEFP